MKSREMLKNSIELPENALFIIQCGSFDHTVSFSPKKEKYYLPLSNS